MNIISVEKNKVHKTIEGMKQHQDRPYGFNQSIHAPVISNLERSLAITGTLLTRADLPNREIIAKAHYFAQVALAEAQMRMNNDISER